MEQTGRNQIDRRTVLQTVAAGGALSLLPAGVSAASVFGEDSPLPCGTRRVTSHTPSGSDAGGSPPTACEVPTGLPGHEPVVRVDSEGTVYFSVVDDPVGIARSTDDGETWENLELPEGAQTAGLDLGGGTATANEMGTPTENATGTATVSGNATGGIPGTDNGTETGSLDLSRQYRRKGTSYLHLDEDTDRLFYGSIGTDPILFSDDGGESWTPGEIPDDVTMWDWPKVFTGPPVDSDTGDYPNVVYYLDFTGERDQTSLFRSVDGGRTYEEVSIVGEQGDCTTDANDREQLVHGVGRVDGDGTVYVPLHACGNMVVAVSEDEGETWERRRVTDATYPNGVGQIFQWTDLETLFEDPQSFNLLQGFEVIPLAQVLTIDDDGTIYVVWVDESDVTLRVAYSRDAGRSWSDPVPVTPDGVSRTVLPGLAVGDAGRLGLSYVGNTTGERWHAYLAEIPDVFATDPTIHTATITTPTSPVSDDGCCWNGAEPSGLFEQTTVDFAPDGSIWGSFVRDNGDTSWEGLTGRLERGDGGESDGSGASDGGWW